jgi:hypothetical protein
MTIAPAQPLMPSDADLRDFTFMPLDLVRLRRSKAWLIAKRRPEIGFYMLNLWASSWHEVPAASLENDDDVLSDAAMCDPHKWEKVKAEVLRGWIECSDGRLYHPVVAEKALEAWGRKLEERWKRECDRVRKEWRRSDRPGKPLTPTLREFVSEKFPATIRSASHLFPTDTIQSSDGHDAVVQRMSGGHPPENALKGQGQGQDRDRDKDPGSSLRSEPAAVPAPPEQPSPPNALDEDPKAVLFSAGLKWLAKETGKTEKSLRPLLGKMLADIGGDAHAAALLGILRDAKREGKADPIGWIQRMIAGRSPRAGPAPPRKNSDLEAAKSLMREFDERDRAGRTSSDIASSALGIFGPQAGVLPVEDRDESEGRVVDLCGFRTHG